MLKPHLRATVVIAPITTSQQRDVGWEGCSHSERKLKEVMILASGFGLAWASDVYQGRKPAAEEASLGNVNVNEAA